jgi:hypothetical protein
VADKGAVFYDIGDGELTFEGYDDDYAGMIALLVHLRDRFRAHGQDLELFPLDDAPETERQPWGPDHPDYDEMGQ